METRKILFGTYDTAQNGLWTLTGCALSDPVQQTNYVQVLGRREGPLDLSTVLTDGDPVYDSRTLTVTLESSEGTRLDRESRISSMINWLDGWVQEIVLPDDSTRYLKGRVHVAKQYNDPAHAAVTVTAVCEPWRYNKTETKVTLTASSTSKTATLKNAGRLTVVPLIEITGSNASVKLGFGSASWTLSAGTYQLPDLILAQGDHSLTYSGTGTVKITYREAVL